MNKTLKLAFALVLGTLAAMSGPVPAVTCTQCSGQLTTSTYTAQGMTCQGAKDKLDDLAAQDMVDNCGETAIPCNPQLVVDVPCFTNALGKKQVSGHFTHGCAVCTL